MLSISHVSSSSRFTNGKEELWLLRKRPSKKIKIKYVSCFEPFAFQRILGMRLSFNFQQEVRKLYKNKSLVSAENFFKTQLSRCVYWWKFSEFLRCSKIFSDFFGSSAGRTISKKWPCVCVFLRNLRLLTSRNSLLACPCLHFQAMHRDFPSRLYSAYVSLKKVESSALSIDF